jgi:RND family efflux transporter MFP subunit
MNQMVKVRRGPLFSLRGCIAGVLLAGAAALGCEGEPAPPPPTKPEVDVSNPVVDSVADFEVFTGRTQAMNSADIRARVTGYLVEAPFEEGADVKKGVTLFKIDTRTYDAALAQTDALLKQAEAHRKVMADTLVRDAAAPGAIAQQVVIQDQGALDEAVAAVNSARASRDAAKLNVTYTDVIAPFSGRISRRLADPGNDVIADNTILASLIQLDPLYGYFDVDERTLLRIGSLLPEGKVTPEAAKRLPLTLGLANEKPEEFSHRGVLKIADNKVDPTTGTVRMWGTFENPKYDLKPGMFVRVRMDVGEPQQSLFVAEAALGSDQGRQYLYTINDENRAVYTQVEVGQKKNGLIAVKPVKDYHLAATDRVVIAGLQRIHPEVDKEGKQRAMQVQPKELVPMPRAKTPAMETPVVTDKN